MALFSSLNVTDYRKAAAAWHRLVGCVEALPAE